MMLRILLLFTCLLGLAAISARAQAATTCSAVAQNIVFPAYSGNTQVTATGNVTVNCSSNVIQGNQFNQTNVTVCVYLGNTPRQMSNGSNTLNYDLRTSSGTSWGNTSPAPAGQVFTMQPFGTPTGSGSITIPINAVLPAPQAGVVNGTYSQSYSGQPQAWVEYAANQTNNGGNPGYPACSSTVSNDGHGTVPLSFTVSVTTNPMCQIKTATDLAFGTVDGLMTANADQTSLITLNCVSPTAYTIGLNNGTHANGSTRQMADASGNLVAYELYRDSGRTQRWGNTINTDTVAGTGTGLDQTLTVYGRVPPQTATPGNYSDVITVTVSY